MSINVIPATVLATGPQFTIFPNEILVEILKNVVMIAPDAKLGTIIDHNYFGFLNAMGKLPRLRRVSRLFSTLVTIAFYEINLFKFVPLEATQHSIPAILPPISVRKYLRQIQINIILQDHFLTANPDGYLKPTPALRYINNPIVTANQLFEHCAGARQLRDLTNALTGFGGLEVLNLNIVANFSGGGDVQRSLAVIKAADFKVTAGKVNVVVTTSWGASLDWHPKLVATIVG